jgi:hypothetical protein
MTLASSNVPINSAPYERHRATERTESWTWPTKVFFVAVAGAEVADFLVVLVDAEREDAFLVVAALVAIYVSLLIVNMVSV